MMTRVRVGQQEYNRSYYEKHRGAIRAQQSVYRVVNQGKIVAARKGLTVAQFEAMLDRQGGMCAICGVDLTRPHIDHDHSCCPGSDCCGACVRGLLCASCNHMLGKAHDMPTVLESGATYLRNFSEGGL